MEQNPEDDLSVNLSSGQVTHLLLPTRYHELNRQLQSTWNERENLFSDRSRVEKLEKKRIYKFHKEDKLFELFSDMSESVLQSLSGGAFTRLLYPEDNLSTLSMFELEGGVPTHTDRGIMTFIYCPSGSISMSYGKEPLPDGGLGVFCGATLEAASSGIYPAAAHEVLPSPKDDMGVTRARYSIVFHLRGSGTALVNPDKSSSETIGDFLTAIDSLHFSVNAKAEHQQPSSALTADSTIISNLLIKTRTGEEEGEGEGDKQVPHSSEDSLDGGDYDMPTASECVIPSEYATSRSHTKFTSTSDRSITIGTSSYCNDRDSDDCVVIESADNIVIPSHHHNSTFLTSLINGVTRSVDEVVWMLTRRFYDTPFENKALLNKNGETVRTINLYNMSKKRYPRYNVEGVDDTSDDAVWVLFKKYGNIPNNYDVHVIMDIDSTLKDAFDFLVEHHQGKSVFFRADLSGFWFWLDGKRQVTLPTHTDSVPLKQTISISPHLLSHFSSFGQKDEHCKVSFSRESQSETLAEYHPIQDMTLGNMGFKRGRKNIIRYQYEKVFD